MTKNQSPYSRNAGACNMPIVYKSPFFVELWNCGSVELWNCGTVELWNCGTLHYALWILHCSCESEVENNSILLTENFFP